MGEGTFLGRPMDVPLTIQAFVILLLVQYLITHR